MVIDHHPSWRASLEDLPDRILRMVNCKIRRKIAEDLWRGILWSVGQGDLGELRRDEQEECRLVASPSPVAPGSSVLRVRQWSDS